MAFFNWSRTAATNASADPTINFAEGQPPSSLNDSDRAMMARLREWGSDISGAIVTTGTSTAYVVTSYQVFDTLAHLDGQMLAFTPHATNGATVTLNVDGLGAKPLRASPSVELPSGTLIQGTPYVATYNNSDAAFYLQGGTSNPYGIPLGGLLPYTNSSAPNSAFVLPYGQAISRTTYASYFAMVSTVFGSGDGSTTFNVPDLRGRIPAGLDNMGGSSANRLSTVISSTTFGASGGAQNQTIGQANLPNVNFSVTDPGHTHNFSASYQIGSGSVNTINPTSGPAQVVQSFVSPSIAAATTGISVNSGGSGTALNTTQPTLMLYYILRII